jgi:hypothetical protein
VPLFGLVLPHKMRVVLWPRYSNLNSVVIQPTHANDYGIRHSQMLRGHT